MILKKKKKIHLPMQKKQDTWVQSPGGGNGNPFQYSCLENPMDEEAGGLQSMGSQSQT